MKMAWSITGTKELKSNIVRTKIGIIGATKKAMLEDAQEIMKESKQEVPVVTGTLLRSAFIHTTPSGDVEFGYGEGDVVNPIHGEHVLDYMVAVHERLDLTHPTGKAKFLEDPVNKYQQRMETSLMGKIRRLFKF